MRAAGRVTACAFLLGLSLVHISAGEAVVLKGGARIELKKPPVRQGDVLLLTRSDGTLLRVQAADIDWKATAAAGSTTRAPSKDEPTTASPERPAQAMRAGRNGPKARIKLTDSDVAHVAEEQGPGEREKKGDVRSVARSTVPEYAQQQAGGKPILYDFTAAWCPPCHQLDTEGFGDPQIASLISSAFQLSRIVDRKREDGKNSPETDDLERRYSVNGFPTLVVATPEGRPIARLDGYPGRRSLLQFLQQSSRGAP